MDPNTLYKPHRHMRDRQGRWIDQTQPNPPDGKLAWEARSQPLRWFLDFLNGSWSRTRNEYGIVFLFSAILSDVDFFGQVFLLVCYRGDPQHRPDHTKDQWFTRQPRRKRSNIAGLPNLPSDQQGWPGRTRDHYVCVWGLSDVMDAQGISRWFQRNQDSDYTKGPVYMTDKEYYSKWQTNSKNPMLFMENTRFLAREECNYILAQQCVGCSDEELQGQIVKNMACGVSGAPLGGRLATFAVGPPEIEPYLKELDKTSGRAHQNTKAFEKYRSWYLRKIDELPALALKYASADARYVLYGFILFGLTRKHRSTDPEHGTDFCCLLEKVMEGIRKDCSVPFVFHPPSQSHLEDLRQLHQQVLLVDDYKARLNECLTHTRQVAKACFARWKEEGCRRATRITFWTAIREPLYHWFNRPEVITPNMRGFILLQQRLLWDIWAEWNAVFAGTWSEMICHQVNAGKTLRPMPTQKDLPIMSKGEADDWLLTRKCSWDLEEGLRSWQGCQRYYYSVTPSSLGYLSVHPGVPKDVPEGGLVGAARIRPELKIEQAGPTPATDNKLKELDEMPVPQPDMLGIYSALLNGSGMPLVLDLGIESATYEREHVRQFTESLISKFRDPNTHSLLPLMIPKTPEQRMQHFIVTLEAREPPDEWYLLRLDGVIEQLLAEGKMVLADLINLSDFLLLRLGNYLLLNPHFLWKYIMYQIMQQHPTAGAVVLPVQLSQIMERAHPMVPPHYRLELQRWRLAHFAIPRPNRFGGAVV